MAFGTSRDELLRFLKREVERGRVPVNTGLSRLASVRKVLSVLSDQEAEDITSLDADAVMRRFLVRSEHQYSLSSQVSYKSRLRSALEEFKAARAPISGPSPTPVQVAPAVVVNVKQQLQSVQVPLPRGCTVLIDRLPVDLTEAEAQRIGNVLLAYAMAG